MSYEERFALVAALLVRNGWILFPGGPALAVKTWGTAVGPKQGSAYLSRSGSDDPNQSLYGSYTSEGRNVMPTVLIPKAASVEEVERLVAQFAREADAAVAASYAARLLAGG